MPNMPRSPLINALVPGAITAIACATVFGAAILFRDSGGSENPFYGHCDRSGGIVAQWSHGKTSTEICIVNGRVTDHLGRDLP